MAETPIKLGAALQIRARQAGKLNDLSGRIKKNAKMQEGDESPPEDPKALMAEFEKVSAEHSELVRRIADTNQQTEVNGRTLIAKLHERQHLHRVRKMLEMAANEATPTHDYRWARAELRFIPQLVVTELRDRIDLLDEEIRELDAIIQEVNWGTDLI